MHFNQSIIDEKLASLRQLLYKPVEQPKQKFVNAKEMELKGDLDKKAKAQAIKQEALKRAESERLLRAEQRRQARADKERKRLLKQIEDRKVIPTRNINLEETIPVRIDHKTIVYVKPGTNIEKVKEKFSPKPVAKPDENNWPPTYQF